MNRVGYSLLPKFIKKEYTVEQEEHIALSNQCLVEVFISMSKSKIPKEWSRERMSSRGILYNLYTVTNVIADTILIS